MKRRKLSFKNDGMGITSLSSWPFQRIVHQIVIRRPVGFNIADIQAGCIQPKRIHRVFAAEKVDKISWRIVRPVVC